MATARDAIKTACQALRVTGFGQAPSSAQAEYGLARLNAYVRELLESHRIPVKNVVLDGSAELSTRWPAWRFQCKSGGTITLPAGSNCDPIPDGYRVEAVDVAGTAASSNI